MLQIDFINVGYGDAILIQSFFQRESPFRLLIDCGDLTTGIPNNGQKRISAAKYLSQQGINSLDIVILTHLHLDHAGGLRELVDSVKIAELWSNYIPDETIIGKKLSIPAEFNSDMQNLLVSLDLFSACLARLSKEKTKIQCISKDMKINFEDTGIEMEIRVAAEKLYQAQNEAFSTAGSNNPDEMLLSRLGTFINDTSLRIRINYGSFSVELPGDVYAVQWEKCHNEPCTILKLPHHGHNNSMTEELFDQLSPIFTVISVSNDRKDNCPSSQITSLIEEKGSTLLFTDAVEIEQQKGHQHQAIRFIINEDSLNWSYI